MGFNLIFIFKLILLFVLVPLLIRHIKKRKKLNLQKFDLFYVFYSIGILLYLFNFNKLAVLSYIMAFYFNMRAFCGDEFYKDFKEWEKGKNLSIKNKILILLSFEINVDFELYRFDKRVKH